MTSLKNNYQVFSHPKINGINSHKNIKSPWNIKPGINVREDGNLVVSHNRISEKNKMSIYSFNKKIE